MAGFSRICVLALGAACALASEEFVINIPADQLPTGVDADSGDVMMFLDKDDYDLDTENQVVLRKLSEASFLSMEEKDAAVDEHLRTASFLSESEDDYDPDMGNMDDINSMPRIGGHGGRPAPDMQPMENAQPTMGNMANALESGQAASDARTSPMMGDMMSQYKKFLGQYMAKEGGNIPNIPGPQDMEREYHREPPRHHRHREEDYDDRDRDRDDDDYRPRRSHGHHHMRPAYDDDDEYDRPRRHMRRERDDDDDYEPRRRYREEDYEEDRRPRRHYDDRDEERRPHRESRGGARPEAPHRPMKAHLLRVAPAMEPGPEIGGSSHELSAKDMERLNKEEKDDQMMMSRPSFGEKRPSGSRPAPMPLMSSTSSSLPAPEATIFMTDKK